MITEIAILGAVTAYTVITEIRKRRAERAAARNRYRASIRRLGLTIRRRRERRIMRLQALMDEIWASRHEPEPNRHTRGLASLIGGVAGARGQNQHRPL